VLALLDVLALGGRGGTGTLLGGHGHTVVLLVCLTEGSGIDLDDGTLDEGVSADQLVVRSVEDDTENTGLGGDVLRAPCEVAALETESALLDVPTTDTDGVDALGADTGVGSLATELELSLLAVVRLASTRGGALVSGGTADTHDVCFVDGLRLDSSLG